MSRILGKNFFLDRGIEEGYNDRMNPNQILIRQLAADASAYIADFFSPYDARISDDDTDYLPAASSLLTSALAALTDDDPDAACDDLAARMIAATDDIDPDFLFADALTAQFNSPIFDLMPTLND